MFCLGNPDRRGGLVPQEIQVRGGVKKQPHPSGGADFFWNNPIYICYLPAGMSILGKTVSGVLSTA